MGKKYFLEEDFIPFWGNCCFFVLSFLKLRIRDSKVVCRLASIRIHDAKKRLRAGGVQ